MKKRVFSKIIFLILVTSLIESCAIDKSSSTGWVKENIVSKRIGNIYFTFPAKGFAYDQRDVLANECLKDYKENLGSLHLPFNNIQYNT